MRKEIPLALALITTTIFCPAQNASRVADENSVAQTSFFAELGGPGILFSANIDRRFTKTNLGVGGRFGIGFVSGYFDPNGYGKQSSVATFPVQLNYVFGKPNSHHTFEAGLGATFTGKKIMIMDFEDSASTYLTACFMYRRQPVNGGFSWRIGFTPILAKGFIEPSAAVSLGYNF